jgi:hypothetical protein
MEPVATMAVLFGTTKRVRRGVSASKKKSDEVAANGFEGFILTA